MHFDAELQEAVLIKRYKRFLADVETVNGEQITLHCPNTGSMKNCQQPGSRVWYTDSGNPKRKYPCTWQIIENQERELIGINTGIANSLVSEAITAGKVPALNDYGKLRREVPYGEQKSRIDLLLEQSARHPDAYVEVKNVTLGLGDGLGVFPDAVTSRGQKHLQELMHSVEQGQRAVLFFCVQHSGIERVAPADDIDPEYGGLLREAAASGVEVLAWQAQFSLADNKVELGRQLPVVLD